MRGARSAAFAAWLHLDAGNPAASLQCHDVAQELAHRSHDRQAVACALVDRAMARTDLGAGRAVAIQDDLGHHSEATLGYRTVHVSISSSDIGGYVAEHDIELARRIEAAAAEHGAQ